MSRPDLTIAVLLPDVLGTYSDAGNAVVLAQRARWRGVDAEIRHVTADSVPPASYDIYLLGGGEDTAQTFAVGWLSRHRALLHAMTHHAQTLAVCAGMQILGHSITDDRGRRHDGLDLLDLSTAPGRRRAVGEITTRCTLPGVGLLTGFENHRGASTGGAGLHPLGRVLSGAGNQGRRRSGIEGAVTARVLATYLHGPVLARNPALADHLLRRVVGPDLAELPDTREPPDLVDLRRTYLGPGSRRQLGALLGRPRRRR